MTTNKDAIKQSAGWKSILLRLLAAAGLALLGLGWPRLLSGRSAWIEAHYSETIYQSIRRAISAATSLVPFSIAEFLLYGLTLGAAAILIVRIVQLLMRRIPFRRLIWSVTSLLLAAGVILNLFYITWGFNYFRAPLSERMGLEIAARPVDELEMFVRNTASEARALRETLSEDGEGVFAPKESTAELFDKLPEAYAALSTVFPVFQPDPTRAKQIFWSRGLSWQGISGVYIGLTAEPNVNTDQPPLLLYQAAAHEMAHQTGIASENEAEFTAYLACRYSDDPNIRYSGLIYALIVSGNALFDADSERYLLATETYGDAIWRDLSAYNAYWDAFDGEVRESADRRNDAYLKHNSQPSGIRSYGESVDLLLAFAAKYGI
ncbi:MAG: DUF3810 domain-containing protein [Clostridiales bacterium]|nr:DUF3810 domain-containing protein [Clostridiales bacterium]